MKYIIMAMFYKQELLDPDNQEDYRFALELMHNSYVGPGDPVLEYLYHQEFGPPEEFERAKKSP